MYVFCAQKQSFILEFPLQAFKKSSIPYWFQIYVFTVVEIWKPFCLNISLKPGNFKNSWLK